MDVENTAKLDRITNPDVLLKIANSASMCAPDSIFINTGSRTFLQYLLKPITNAMARSFREE